MYTSQSESLAALELLVHLQASHLLLSYCAIPTDFDDALVTAVDAAALPPDWTEFPAPSALQKIGDRWTAEGRSVVLKVPSAIVPTELNYLLNPRHPDFRRVKIGKPKPFPFDRRLKS